MEIKATQNALLNFTVWQMCTPKKYAATTGAALKARTKSLKCRCDNFYMPMATGSGYTIKSYLKILPRRMPYFTINGFTRCFNIFQPANFPGLPHGINVSAGILPFTGYLYIY